MPEGERFCPYVGLTHYSEEDAPYFFGRDAERELLSANLLASRFTLVYGPSGVGKSSVLRAGVAHHLKHAAKRNLLERGSPEYAITVFNTWRDEPVSGLLHTIARDIEELTGKPTPLPAAGFIDSLATLAAAAGGELLIILDQFEEYFLYHPDEDGPGTFAWEFPKALSADLPVGFLVSIREDSLARLDRFKGRINQLFDNYLRIDNINEDAARAAIVLPLREYNRKGKHGRFIAIEHQLVKQVLRDVSADLQLGDSGGGSGPARPARAKIETPYLQLIMMRLWEQEHTAGSRVLRLQTLIDLGSAARIVRTHLDTALSALSEEERDTAAEIFRYLVTPSRTKIAHTVADLAEFANVEPSKVESLLEKLSSGSHRILCPVAPAPDQPTNLRYQIFHDVLAAGIVEWRRTRESRRALEAAGRREQDQRERAEREARSARRFRLVAAAFAVAFVLMIVVATYAVSQRNAARNAQKLAEQRDVEKLAFASRAEQQRLMAEAERQEKLGFQKNANDLRTLATEQGKRAADAERLAMDQGIRITNAAKQMDDLRKESELLKNQNDSLTKDLRAARDEIGVLQKTVADLRKQLEAAAARKQSEKENALAAKERTPPVKGPPSVAPAAEYRIPGALAIGISQYEQPINPLRWAAADAQSFGTFLAQSNSGPVELLLDSEATQAAILRTLTDLLARLSPRDQLVLFLSARVMEQDGSFYILPQDADPQDLRLTAISLGDISAWIKGCYGRVRVIADLYDSGARDKNRLQVLLNAFAGVNSTSAAVAYLHQTEDNPLADSHRSLAVLLQSAAANRSEASAQDLVTEALRRLAPAGANLKLLQGGSNFLIYDESQASSLPARRPVVITLPRPALPASSQLLAEGTERALSRLKQSESQLSPAAFEAASRRLLIALENRGNQVIRRSLRAFENSVTRHDYEECAQDFAAALMLRQGPSATALEPQRRFCEGSALLLSSRYVDAVPILRSAGGTGEELVANALGMAYLQGREYDRAKPLFQQAMGAAPHWAYPVRNLAQLQAAQGNLADASRTYRTATDLAPESATLVYEFAEVERQRGEAGNAERLLRLGAAMAPRDAAIRARCYVALGQLRTAAGQRAQAEQFFREALSVRPDSVEALQGLATLARQAGKLDEAEKYWREVIRLTPDHLGANLGLGELLTVQRKFQEAAELYSRALNGNPTSIPLLKAAAHSMLFTSRLPEAESIATKLLALVPRDPEGWDLLGDSQLAEGRLSEARDSYSRALASSPPDRLRKSIRAKLEKIGSPQ